MFGIPSWRRRFLSTSRLSGLFPLRVTVFWVEAGSRSVYRSTDWIYMSRVWAGTTGRCKSESTRWHLAVCSLSLDVQLMFGVWLCLLRLHVKKKLGCDFTLVSSLPGSFPPLLPPPVWYDIAARLQQSSTADGWRPVKVREVHLRRLWTPPVTTATTDKSHRCCLVLSPSFL